MATPGCTLASNSSVLTSTIRFNPGQHEHDPARERDVPAHRSDPATRGTTGTPRRVANRRISATSAVLPGNTTAAAP